MSSGIQLLEDGNTRCRRRRPTPEATTVVGLKIAIAEEATPGTTFTTHLVHLRADGIQLAGAVAVQVRVRGSNENDETRNRS